MSLWNKIFGAKNKTNIKRSYKLGNYIIQLQESPIAFSGSRPSNIVAYDEKGNIKWVAENPHADFVYHDMQVDEGSNTVIGDAGTGRIYEIELMTGKIIRSSLVK